MAAALVVSSLAACDGRLGGPAPVVAYGASGSGSYGAAGPSAARPARAMLPPPRESMAGAIIVRPGETLYAISRRTNAPLRALIDANNLHPPYSLQAGQHLTVPHVRSYQVQPGDTLAVVARRYGVESRELVQANALTPPYSLRTGQVLVLPAASGIAPAMAVAQAPVAAPPPNVGFHPVATASLPPPRAPAPQVAAAVAPPPSAPAQPVGAPGVIVAAPSSPPPAQAPFEPPPARPAAVAGAGPVAALPMPPAVTPSTIVEPASLTRVEPPAAAPEETVPVPAGHAGLFLWPVHGTIVSDYGSKPGGLQNDGINIAAPRGTPIHAADAGVVVYAGNELRGFGNLLLVKHRGGWVTAYAHAEDLLVHRGEEVRRGQVVARVGNTGGVGTPQLHFEIRKGAHPLNPRDYLGPQTASASP